MKIPASPACHLSYCTNIHPGESWRQCFASLKRYLPEVKNRVSANEPFGVGLRLSAEAASALTQKPAELESFCRWLTEEALYVFTLNGFPYGTFHGEAIKENVYLPHWGATERLVYTRQLAVILAELLRAQEKLGQGVESQRGSISTVPVGFKRLFAEEAARQAALQNLMAWVSFAWELEQNTGKWIQLALEPEPSCYLEDARGTLAFFKDYVYSNEAKAYLANQGLEPHLCSQETIKRYLGICLDTCHAAVMFEDAVEFAEQMRAADISLPKLQLTTALQVSAPNDAKLEALAPFAENQYLHQSTLFTGRHHQFFLDLPEAIEAVAHMNTTLSDANTQQEKQRILRSHFHVPVFVEQLGLIESTQQELLTFLAAQKKEQYSTHLEVETYTFDVLPQGARASSVEQAIAGEVLWVKERL